MIGEHLAAVLNQLPNQGSLFPHISKTSDNARSSEFRRRCNTVRVYGISLHSYRYAWAERAKTCGYPERFAQEALGHNSKAVHRAYAKKAKVNLPSLEEYEKLHAGGKVIALPVPNSTPAVRDGASKPRHRNAPVAEHRAGSKRLKKGAQHESTSIVLLYPLFKWLNYAVASMVSISTWRRSGCHRCSLRGF
jgi:hypothetical protein